MSRPLVRAILKFLKQEDGPTAVEYAVMLSLIVCVCTASISAIGENASSTFDSRCDRDRNRQQRVVEWRPCH